MINTTKSFLKNIQGEWILQKTTYYINKKNIFSNKTQNHIEVINNKQILNSFNKDISQMYSFKNINLNINECVWNLFKIQKNIGSIKKNHNNFNYNGKFELQSNRCAKIIFRTKSVIYIEYLYILTQNFNISISIIKTQKKYLAVTFTSCIKKIIA